MQLVWNDDVQQLIYCDKSSFYIYNEDEENSELLRKVTGAHKSNISTI